MHIEVRDAGGKIGKGLFANLGGPEFVIDSDSYMAIEGTLPGFLAALNAADGKQAVKVLENYASYEGMGGETIIVNNIQKVSPSKSNQSLVDLILLWVVLVSVRQILPMQWVKYK